MSGSPSPESEADAARLPYRIDRNFTRGLVWLRRDLRTDDNAALHYALKHCRQVWCVFVFDREILAPLLARGLHADRRVEFILRSLEPLRRALEDSGGGLIVLDGTARQAIRGWPPSLKWRPSSPTMITSRPPTIATTPCAGRWPPTAGCCSRSRTRSSSNATRS
jgi:hypothetical protein